ncbi:unnamed protein product [Cylindrotheca closterium]|uniref:SET domain-containing protein n=1 Tax=Cylindrotheca closterium TaxID=2856 RepID=A0AAD2FNR5_9STRA|nr:unnamed protein product [Cylindrotheca closterium]
MYDEAFPPGLMLHMADLIQAAPPNLQFVVSAKVNRESCYSQLLIDAGLTELGNVKGSKTNNGGATTFTLFKRLEPQTNKDGGSAAPATASVSPVPEKETLHLQIEGELERFTVGGSYESRLKYYEALKASTQKTMQREKKLRKLHSKKREKKHCLCAAQAMCEAKCIGCEEYFAHISEDELTSKKVTWLPNQQGLFCKTKLNKDQFVVEYAGRIRKTTSTDCDRYVLCFDGKRINARGYGIQQFVNHSCNPNCTLTKWTDEYGKSRVSIRTKSNIPSETELTVDYGSEREPFDCICARCRPITKTVMWFGMTGTTFESMKVDRPSITLGRSGKKKWLADFCSRNGNKLGKQDARDFLRISAARWKKTEVYSVSIQTIDEIEMLNRDPVFHNNCDWNSPDCLAKIVGKVDVVECDWVWMPASYLSDCLKNGFFTKVIPELIKCHLAPGGYILLPLQIPILDRVLAHQNEGKYSVTLLTEQEATKLSPLLQATHELQAIMTDKETRRVMGKAKQQLDHYAGIESLSVVDQTVSSAIDVKDFLNNYAEENGDIGKLRFICIKSKQPSKSSQAAGIKIKQRSKRKQTTKPTAAGKRKSVPTTEPVKATTSGAKRNKRAAGKRKQTTKPTAAGKRKSVPTTEPVKATTSGAKRNKRVVAAVVEQSTKAKTKISAAATARSRKAPGCTPREMRLKAKVLG